ncbi:hypothetical protein HCG49_15250 [Arenibacter sp. 6A1]|uniref:hypothetical protein n=1 Tax=Arenibacter sp. 6A1 TaxID=2720391 RepID=UPI001446CC32|nr:hypothetical protein [Arenibacter sp. 6A1]NKI27918.1 hypothetical protein [Arenibacter sp. 6A1]
MAIEELKENLSEAEKNLRSYVDNTAEYYKLKSFKLFMRGVATMAKVLLVGGVALLALFILSLAAAFGIGQALENTFLGFLFVGLFYILVGLMCYWFRHKLDKPILKKFSKYYFEE